VEKLYSLAEKTLTTQKGRTTAIGVLSIGGGAVIGGTIGFWSAAYNTLMAVTAPISYPATGYGIGKLIEFGMGQVAAEDPEDLAAKEVSEVPFAKILATGNLAYVPFAPIKLATAWVAIPAGFVSGAVIGASGTYAFHHAQTNNQELADEQGKELYIKFLETVDEVKSTAA